MESTTPAYNKQNAALEQYRELHKFFQEKAHRGKWLTLWIKILSVVLTATVTVLGTAMSPHAMGQYPWLIPGVGALATICASLQAAINAERTWVLSRRVQHELEAEQFLYLQEAGVYAEGNEAQKTAHFSNRLVEIWADGHQNWEKSMGNTIPTN